MSGGISHTGQYLSLDTDHNGMLSKDELARYIDIESLRIILTTCRYRTGTMTKVFIDRVFQECLTYEGEMVCASVTVSPPHLSHVCYRITRLISTLY